MWLLSQYRELGLYEWTHLWQHQEFLKTIWKKLWAAINSLTANARRKLNNNMHSLFRRLNLGMKNLHVLMILLQYQHRDSESFWFLNELITTFKYSYRLTPLFIFLPWKPILLFFLSLPLLKINIFDHKMLIVAISSTLLDFSTS